MNIFPSIIFQKMFLFEKHGWNKKSLSLEPFLELKDPKTALGPTSEYQINNSLNFTNIKNLGAQSNFSIINP